jgi:hypothetical protein
LEASTGIEPVYTDLQSRLLLNQNNAVGPKPYQDKRCTKREPDTRRKSSSAGRTFSDFAKPAHKSLSRSLGYCLTLGTADAWSSFATIAAMRLSPFERGAIAAAALKSMPIDLAEMAAAAVIGAAGNPLPAFLGGMDDARFWASMASRSERKAYALASFEAMTAKDRAAFTRHITGGRAAA